MRSRALKNTIVFLLTATIYCNSYSQTGTWTKVMAPSPDYNLGVMLLMTDGTVIVHNSNGTGQGTGWDKLTPDAYGSYANGTWSTIAYMNKDRFAFPSQVLPSGKVFVAGGEYGTGGNYAEVFDPVLNTWTNTHGVPGTEYGQPSGTPDNIYDGNSEMLANGDVFVGPQVGPNPSDDCLFFDPGTNVWAVAPTAPLNHDEAEWLKLPDGSVLFVGMATTQSCRYIPQTNKWITDGNVPVAIFDNGYESGCATMLPNGKAIFFGATRYNAIYSPTGTAAPGTWTTAADFPVIDGQLVGQVDAPGAMMVNGHELLAVSPEGTTPANEYSPPVYFLEYNYTTNTFTQVTSIIPDYFDYNIEDITCSGIVFLDLPDGTVLMAVEGNNNYYIYTPGSSPISHGKPTINSILPDACPLYKITGKLFNGISEGASYGDDWQMSTNYPLVRLSNSAGNVYYCKTTNWNRVGAVMTDSLEDTATFETPSYLPAGTYSLVVVANGFASNPVAFSILALTSVVNANSDCGGSSTGMASATASGGMPPYTYAWTGGAGNNATATALSAGTYTVTVSDNNGCENSSAVTITGTDNMVIYPDPNSGVFSISGLCQNDIVDMYNYLGQKLSSTQINSNTTLQFNISNQPSGVYLIRILNESGTVLLVQKIVKI